MKITILIILGVLSDALVWANGDTLNFYVTNNSDTIYVNDFANILVCNYLISIEKSHNKCMITIEDDLYTGKLYYQMSRADSMLQVFDGEIVDGLIKNGTILRYSTTGQLILSGQYYDNWKYGIWTSYYKNGQIESVMKFIVNADYPVVEWNYDESGRLVYHNDEQKEIEKRIKNAR